MSELEAENTHPEESAAFSTENAEKETEVSGAESLDKTKLFSIAAQLEAELEAFHFVLTSLKKDNSRKHKVLLQYGQLNRSDPFSALHRDSQLVSSNSPNTPGSDQTATGAESAKSSNSQSKSACQDSCLHQATLVTHQPLLFVEELVKTHKRNLNRLGAQILHLERRYHKALTDLEDEKRKHAQDQAVGEEVSYHLEKERDKLVLKLEDEQQARKGMENNLLKIKQLLMNERSRRQSDTVKLLKDRQSLVYKLYNEKKQVQSLKEQMAAETKKVSQLSSTVEELNERCKSLESNASAQNSEESKSDFEKQQLELKLTRSEKQCSNLHEEIIRLKERIYELEKGKIPTSDIPEIVESRQPLSQPVQQPRREYAPPPNMHSHGGAVIKLNPSTTPGGVASPQTLPAHSRAHSMSNNSVQSMSSATTQNSSPSLAGSRVSPVTPNSAGVSAGLFSTPAQTAASSQYHQSPAQIGIPPKRSSNAGRFMSEDVSVNGPMPHSSKLMGGVSSISNSQFNSYQLHSLSQLTSPTSSGLAVSPTDHISLDRFASLVNGKDSFDGSLDFGSGDKNVSLFMSKKTTTSVTASHSLRHPSSALSSPLSNSRLSPTSPDLFASTLPNMAASSIPGSRQTVVNTLPSPTTVGSYHPSNQNLSQVPSSNMQSKSMSSNSYQNMVQPKFRIQTGGSPGGQVTGAYPKFSSAAAGVTKPDPPARTSSSLSHQSVNNSASSATTAAGGQ